MKIEVKESQGEIFGIELLAETEIERKVLSRFKNNGIKINIYNDEMLQLTFRDMVAKDACVVMLLEEALKEAQELYSKRCEEDSIRDY